MRFWGELKSSWCILVMRAIFRICGSENQPGLQLAEGLPILFVPRVFKGFQFFVRSHYLIMPVSLNLKWLLDGHTLQCGHNGLSLVGHIFKRCSTMMVAHQGRFYLVPIFVFCLCTGILALRATIS